MRIITLTSDMGTQDYYVAAVKATILGLYPQAQIIDVSHHLRPFDIAQAAFVIKNVYNSFPPGSIHILGINSEKTNPLAQPGAPLTRHVIVEYNGHYFIGADNGIFSLFIEAAPIAVYEIDFGTENEEQTFPVKTVFARAAAMIASGKAPSTFGKKINELNQRTIIAPTISHKLIIGTVIYIDAYGNAIFNITKADFEKHTAGKDYKLVLR
ncbi:MAG TPA: SAM-dependent chlorinase/fluorinase, partial [Flavobacteriales bacterium]|nr:SAM-dependent chlorinase/fluorinase [Flavobacteriales bacterium]